MAHGQDKWRRTAAGLAIGLVVSAPSACLHFLWCMHQVSHKTGVALTIIKRLPSAPIPPVGAVPPCRRVPPAKAARANQQVPRVGCCGEG